MDDVHCFQFWSRMRWRSGSTQGGELRWYTYNSNLIDSYGYGNETLQFTHILLTCFAVLFHSSPLFPFQLSFSHKIFHHFHSLLFPRVFVHFASFSRVFVYLFIRFLTPFTHSPPVFVHFSRILYNLLSLSTLSPVFVRFSRVSHHFLSFSFLLFSRVCSRFFYHFCLCLCLFHLPTPSASIVNSVCVQHIG